MFVYRIVILFVSLTDEIESKRFVCFWKRVSRFIAFVVKSKLVTVLLLLQIYLAIHKGIFLVRQP